MCPKGDDPLTTFTDYRTITLNTSVASGHLDGTFKFSFNGESFYFPANALLWSEDDCKLAFESLPNIESVTCTRGHVHHSNASSYIIKFLSFPTYPYENNVYTHTGDPPLSSFTCDSSRVNHNVAQSVSCVVHDASLSANPSLPG